MRWLRQAHNMAPPTPTTLAAVSDRAAELQLTIRHPSNGDLVVIGCAPSAKAALTTLIKFASDLALNVKWMNDGTLVCLGLPTQKPAVPPLNPPRH